MLSLEDRLQAAGFWRIAGLDEAGRGAWAGPVVVAVVVPDLSAWPLLGVDDSKQLSSGERAALAKRIREAGWSFAFGEATPKEIDCWNVLEATRLAARRALEKLHPKPDFLLTDALALPGTGIPFLPVLRADTWSYSVACASILAKVERDQRMVQVGREYPQYGFEIHKGYGVPEHRAALARFGPCPEHRLSFRPVLPRLQGKRVA